MVFNEVIGIQNKPAKAGIIHRVAVRAIVWKDKKLLMVLNNKGDYKFPGGGVEENEDYTEAVIREVLEETGYMIDRVDEKIGMVVERRVDIYKENTIFEMTSNYYLCTIHAEQTDQKLDDYEKELEFQPIWIDIDEAILRNEYLVSKNADMNQWIIRELFVLKKMKDHYK